MQKLVLATSAVLLFAGGVHAQSFTTSGCSVDDGHTSSGFMGIGRQERVCELRRTVLPSRSELKVSGRNGGIEVIGQDRSDIALEARIVGTASTRDEAQSLTREVKIDLGDTIHADGPSPSLLSGRNWYVNFRLLVPRHLGAELHTGNGGLDLTGLDGTINADTTNGGINLHDLSGEVRARTVNGGITVALNGDGWRGAGLFANTTNGGISVHLPDRYSAHLIAQTTNGGVSIAFPVTAELSSRKRVDTNIGSGGSTLQFETVNGGVNINHAGASHESE